MRMKRFFEKPGRWAMVFSFLLCAAFTLTLLDTFVFPKAYAQTSEAESTARTPSSAVQQPVAAESGSTEEQATEAAITATGYEDENISVTVETLHDYDTICYVADVKLADPSLLKTALAGGVYGRNIKETTSGMAEDVGAVFAVNGDYYGFRDTGYVLRNGTLYRDTSGGGEALVIGNDGNLSVVEEGVVSAASLAEAGAWQVLSFGPALVENGQIVVDERSEVSRSKSSNPRTAIGQVAGSDGLHYIFVVSDGRTGESEGLSLLQLARIFEERGATLAYNLDGGGSSTMVLNGEVLNTPTNGRSSGEREVSDIVYIGY